MLFNYNKLTQIVMFGTNIAIYYLTTKLYTFKITQKFVIKFSNIFIADGQVFTINGG